MDEMGTSIERTIVVGVMVVKITFVRILEVEVVMAEKDLAEDEEPLDLDIDLIRESLMDIRSLEGIRLSHERGLSVPILVHVDMMRIRLAETYVPKQYL